MGLAVGPCRVSFLCTAEQAIELFSLSLSLSPGRRRRTLFKMYTNNNIQLNIWKREREEENFPSSFELLTRLEFALLLLVLYAIARTSLFISSRTVRGEAHTHTMRRLMPLLSLSFFLSLVLLLLLFDETSTQLVSRYVQSSRVEWHLSGFLAVNRPDFSNGFQRKSDI